MENLVRLLYVSKADPSLTRSDFDDILKTARKHNERTGITGALCRRAGYFAQVLEGREVPLMERYLAVAADPRHDDLIVIAISLTDNRMYDGWFMGGLDDEGESFVDVEEILRMRRLARQPDDARMLMERWLRLLHERSAPTSAAGTLTSRG
jgi:hypothetical protein